MRSHGVLEITKNKENIRQKCFKRTKGESKSNKTKGKLVNAMLAKSKYQAPHKVCISRLENAERLNAQNKILKYW